jgi:hypothetical protein
MGKAEIRSETISHRPIFLACFWPCMQHREKSVFFLFFFIENNNFIKFLIAD